MTSSRPLVRIALAAVATAILNGGVIAVQEPGIFERDDEGQIWQTLPSFGQPAGDCEWADVTGDSVADPLRELGAPLQCPGGAPVGTDQLYEPRGVAVFDPGPSVGFAGSDPSLDLTRMAQYRVYAADTNNNRIVSWDFFGGSPRAFGSGANPVQLLSPTGEKMVDPNDPVPDDQLFLPEGITVDAIGNIIVADAFNGRLSAFRPLGFEGATTENHWFVKALPPAGAARGHRALPAQIAIADGVIIQPPDTSCTVPRGRTGALPHPAAKSISPAPRESFAP